MGKKKKEINTSVVEVFLPDAFGSEQVFKVLHSHKSRLKQLFLALCRRAIL